MALEAERIPLRGLGRYLVGLMRTLCFRYHYPLTAVTLDGETRHGPTLALTLGIGKREGNFVLVPRRGARRRPFRLRPRRGPDALAVAASGAGRGGGTAPERTSPICGWAAAARRLIRSAVALAAHTDGEFFCRPDQDVHTLEVEILPGRLRVLRRN